MIAESSVQSLSHRSKAAKEVERSFRQGRIDINFLIQTFNSLSDAETKKIRAVGAYHMALNRLAALRDELISDDGKIKYKDVE